MDRQHLLRLFLLVVGDTSEAGVAAEELMSPGHLFRRLSLCSLCIILPELTCPCSWRSSCWVFVCLRNPRFEHPCFAMGMREVQIVAIAKFAVGFLPRTFVGIFSEDPHCCCTAKKEENLVHFATLMDLCHLENSVLEK